MEKKFLVQQQYFDLYGYLNSSNPVKNQPKPMYFYTKYIDGEEYLFAAVSDWQKLSLCKKLKSHHWVGAGDIQYEDLKTEVAKFLPRCLQPQIDLTKCIQRRILGPFT